MRRPFSLHCPDTDASSRQDLTLFRLRCLRCGVLRSTRHIRRLGPVLGHFPSLITLLRHGALQDLDWSITAVQTLRAAIPSSTESKTTSTADADTVFHNLHLERSTCRTSQSPHTATRSCACKIQADPRTARTVEAWNQRQEAESRRCNFGVGFSPISVFNADSPQAISSSQEVRRPRSSRAILGHGALVEGATCGRTLRALRCGYIRESETNGQAPSCLDNCPMLTCAVPPMDRPPRSKGHTTLRLCHKASRQQACQCIPEGCRKVQEEPTFPQELADTRQAVASFRPISQPPEFCPAYVLDARETESRSTCHELDEHR